MHSLRFKLLAPFIAGMALLAASLTWYTWSSAKEEVESAVMAISEAKTSNVVSSMHLLVRSTSTALHNMVADPHVINLLELSTEEARQSGEVWERVTEWIEIVARSNEYYRDIYIVDDKGRCIVSSNPGYVGKARGHEPYVQAALNGHLSTGGFSVGRVTRKLSVTMAGPIDLGTRVAGAVVLVTDFPSIVDYDLKISHASQRVHTLLLTPEGMFAAHPDKSFMASRDRRYPDLYTTLAEVRNAGGPVRYEFEGEEYLGYAKVDPVSQWVVVTSGKQSEVLASAYRMGQAVVMISCMFLACLVGVVVRFASDILHAMFSLINYAKAVSEGDLDRTLASTDREDELGVLHTALQRLVVRLKEILQETRKASEMKGQFLANMSHEIRTPLNAIIGMTHLALREEGLSLRARMFVEKIQMSSRLLFGIINDILDLSKVEAGMMELECLPFETRAALSNAAAIHQETAKDKGLDLVVECAPDVPTRLMGDALRIGQVLNNLLGNAIKFTSQGSITLRCECVSTVMPQEDQESTEGYVILRVSVVDTGVGIATEALEKLFQPFTQADATITRKFGGTGLGLTISSKLVALMDGEMDVQSSYGEGTTMSFTLRLALPTAVDAHLADATVEDSMQRRFDGKRILVAEDNPINQLILEELLTQMGANVYMADNGKEAVDAVQREPFDLVLMDMQMPIMDGLEATRRIRETVGADVLPIVALTANAMKEDKARCFACGMNAYLTKPIEPSLLADVLHRWLGDAGGIGGVEMESFPQEL